MNQDQDFDSKNSHHMTSGCEDQKTREIAPIEGPCPHCGATQEFFTDELREKEEVRCRHCKKMIDVAAFRKAAGL